MREILLFARDFWPTGTVGLPVILILQKEQEALHRKSNLLTAKLCQDPNEVQSGKFKKCYSYPQNYFQTVSYHRFRLFFNAFSKRFVEKLESKAVEATEIVSVHTGVRSKIGQKQIVSERKEGPTWHKGLISGREINRYSIHYAGNYINVNPQLLWSGGWDKEIVEQRKLLMRQTGDSLVVAFDDNRFYHLNNLHSIVLRDKDYDLKYVLALLNSKLINHYYHLISLELGRAMAQTDIETILRLPIYPTDFSRPTESARHNRMIELVDTMLNLHKDLQAAKTDHEKSLIKRQIDSTDKQIDQLVYELYSLTDEEIHIVEEAIEAVQRT